MFFRTNPTTIKELIVALEDLVKYQGADFDDPVYIQGRAGGGGHGDPPDPWVPLRIAEIGPTENAGLFARSIRLSST